MLIDSALATRHAERESVDMTDADSPEAQCCQSAEKRGRDQQTVLTDPDEGGEIGQSRQSEQPRETVHQQAGSEVLGLGQVVLRP